MKQSLTISLEMQSDIVYGLLEIAAQENKSLSELINEISDQFIQMKTQPFSLGVSEVEGEIPIEPIFKAETNRRELPRKPVRIPAILKLNYQKGEVASFIGEARDLSAGGIRVETPDACKDDFISEDKNFGFKVVFRLPDEDKEITLNCTPHRLITEEGVVQIGASFENVNYYDLVKLYDFCGWRQPALSSSK